MFAYTFDCFYKESRHSTIWKT